MAKIEIVIRTRGASFERWREIYHSAELNQDMVRSSKLRARQLVEHSTLDDGRERRKLLVVPDVTLPGPVKKLIGDREIKYYEVTVFDPRSRTATLEIESEASDTIRVSGTVRYAVDGDNVKLNFDGAAEVKIFAVGKLIERFIVGEVEKRYAKLEELLQRLVDDGVTITPARVSSIPS